MAPYSSTLAWKIPWMEEPGRLQSMGSLRVGHNWANSLSLFTFMHWRRKWQPTPVFFPGESQNRGAWWAAIYGVAPSRTRLMQLSSSICNKKHVKIIWMKYFMIRYSTQEFLESPEQYFPFVAQVLKQWVNWWSPKYLYWFHLYFHKTKLGDREYMGLCSVLDNSVVSDCLQPHGL